MAPLIVPVWRALQNRQPGDGHTPEVVALKETSAATRELAAPQYTNASTLGPAPSAGANDPTDSNNGPAPTTNVLPPIWEGSSWNPQTARESRLERARLKERLQAVLGTLGEHGCYVFDELPTEAGLLDYLVIGPTVICTVVIRNDQGIVTPALEEDYGTDELYLNGAPFEDSAKTQAYELTDAIIEKLPETDKPIGHLMCFTEADIRCADGDEHLLRGTCTIWGLLEALTEGEEQLNLADIEEFAEIVESIYNRPPIVRPHTEEGHR